MIDLVVLLAAQECLADEGVAQIVDTSLRMTTAGNPAQTMTESLEDVVNCSLRNRPPIGGDEERLNP
jgi:hypothetical protein